MQTDVLFDVAIVYNVDKKIDVVKGQKFTIRTDLTQNETVKWFTDEDQVLSLWQKGGSAELQALDLGVSTILIMGTDFGIIKQLTITVVDHIAERAVTLGVSSGEPVLK